MCQTHFQFCWLFSAYHVAHQLPTCLLYGSLAAQVPSLLTGKGNTLEKHTGIFEDKTVSRSGASQVRKPRPSQVTQLWPFVSHRQQVPVPLHCLTHSLVPETNDRMIGKVDMTHQAREDLLERDRVWERNC